MKNIRVIIVSHPGTWQRVLQKNIEAYPFVTVIDAVSGSLSATQFIEQKKTDLMVVDSSIPFDDAMALVQNLKRKNPEIRSIVITDTTQQRRRILRAGADYTISSFNYEAQIGEILNQLNQMLSDEAKKSEAIIEKNSGSSNQLLYE